MTELRKTVCNRDCPDACAIVATVENTDLGERVTRLTGDKTHPVTKGFLCYRTNQFLTRQYAPDRITTPLLRDERGDFHAISWDEALDLAANRLQTIRRESGPSAIFHYRSGGSLGLLKFVTDLFFEKFGPVTIKRGDICSGAGDAAQMLDFGLEDSNDVFDLVNAKHILLWGKNVYTSSPHLLPVLRDASSRGAKILLIDPVHHRTAAIADRYIQPRPAGDFDLAMAVAAILFSREFVDPDARSYCDHIDEFRALAGDRTVEEWCLRADVSVAEAEEIAAALGPGKPAAILVGWGMGRRGSGAGIVRALDALGAISGNLGIAGGGVSFYFKRRGAFDASFVKGESAAPRTVCEPLFGPDVLSLSDPPIRAVWITAGNPVAMLPESRTVERALATREFVVVVDSWMSDTARLAHLILPTTTLLEDDDLLGAYGHHFLGASRPVVQPPPTVRSDLSIIQELAKRVGLEAEVAGDARDWKRRMLAPVTAHGVTLEALENGHVRNPLPPKILFADRKFQTPSGRVNLVTSPPPRDPDDAAYPLFLMSLSTEKAQSSQWAVAQEGPAELTVHPDVAAQAKLRDGDFAVLESDLASMRVRVRTDERQRRDVALIPKGGHLREGRCANALLRARTTDLGEGGALYDQRVRLVSD